MSIYQQLLGTPFVYNHVRPLVVGGIDMSPFYERVGAGKDDVILDVGCGTGDALRYLRAFSRYVGIDTDDVAIRYAKKSYADRANVTFESRLCVADDMQKLQPTHIMFCGLLHHLPDDAALNLLGLAKQSPRFKRLVTSDVVYLDREPISNLLASLDRGRYCRRVEGYKDLVARAGLRVEESSIVRSHPTHGLAKYLMMSIER